MPSPNVLFGVVCLKQAVPFRSQPFRNVDEEPWMESLAVQRAFHLRRNSLFNRPIEERLFFFWEADALGRTSGPSFCSFLCSPNALDEGLCHTGRESRPEVAVWGSLAMSSAASSLAIRISRGPCSRERNITLASWPMQFATRGSIAPRRT
jgi:hypothetical protein